MATAAPAARLPRQLPFIIANEGCERFSFYGMRNILVPFLAAGFFAALPKEASAAASKDVFHTFVIGVYFFPLLGGFLSDRWFGKYRTILAFSLVYALGQGCLALFVDEPAGFYTGLALIALGSGGIKPLVATFMGDQFDQTNKHLGKVAFDAFYWIINFGSLFASFLMPLFLKELGPRVAFGIPGILMLVATAAFWSGRRRYVMVPQAPRDPHSFTRVAWSALTAPGALVGRGLAIAGCVLGVGALALVPILELVPAVCLGLVVVLALGGIGTWLELERARGTHPDAAVDGVRAVLRVLVVFALVTPFWSLFDQKASTWVLQAGDMAKPTWFAPAQMQALNPALVLLIIPLNNLVIFPWLRARGYEPTTLRRMTLGMALAGVAWIIVGGLQLALDGGFEVTIVWQILPYLFLTSGEVLVSATGLEFAYSQSPHAMKGVIMSFWSLAVTIGNLWVLIANAGVRNEGVIGLIRRTGVGVTACQMFFFAAFAFLSALAFLVYARRYREVDHYRG